MTQSHIKLILSDIDGTILPHGQTVVDAETRQAIHAALDAGIRFGPASGRAIAGVMPVFAGDKACTETALATNGMQVYLDGKEVYEATLEPAALARVREVVRGIPGAGLIWFEGSRVFLVEGTIAGLEESFPVYAVVAEKAADLPDRPVVKANVFTATDLDVTKAALDALAREVPELDYNLPMPGFVNILPKGWSKARAVDVLAHALGISLDEVCVFGDSGNDLEMLAHVPNSVAVANATPEAAEAAHWHIGPCEDHAVADAIDALAAGEWPFER